MRRYILLVVMVAAMSVGCGDNQKSQPDAGMGNGDDAAMPLAHCLDSPEQVVLPPSGQLPCDLLPPGFGS